MKGRLGDLGPRVFSGLLEAYECLSCDFEWRQPLPENGTSCPACGHLYVEWLSFDINPRDIYFRQDPLPKGAWKVKRKHGNH